MGGSPSAPSCSSEGQSCGSGKWTCCENLKCETINNQLSGHYNECKKLDYTFAGYQCWVRIPGGCATALSETQTPEEWFVDSHKNTGSGCDPWSEYEYGKQCSNYKAETL